MAMGELAHPLEVADVDRRDDDLADAGGARARDDRVAVGVEFGGVEVAMRVDPHGRDDACADARRPRCDRSWPACYRIDEGLRRGSARRIGARLAYRRQAGLPRPG